MQLYWTGEDGEHYYCRTPVGCGSQPVWVFCGGEFGYSTGAAYACSESGCRCGCDGVTYCVDSADQLPSARWQFWGRCEAPCSDVFFNHLTGWYYDVALRFTPVASWCSACDSAYLTDEGECVGRDGWDRAAACCECGYPSRFDEEGRCIGDLGNPVMPSCCDCFGSTDGVCGECGDARLEEWRCVGEDGSDRDPLCCECPEEPELVDGQCRSAWGGRLLAARCCECDGASLDPTSQDCRSDTGERRPASCCAP